MNARRCGACDSLSDRVVIVPAKTRTHPKELPDSRSVSRFVFPLLFLVWTQRCSQRHDR